MTSKQLKQQRKQVLGKITRFSKFLEAYNEEKYLELIERYETLDQISLEFNETQSQLEALLKDRDLEQQESERESFENIFYQIKSKAKGIIVQYETKTNTENGNHNVKTDTLKLPSMSLPEFNGEYHQWLQFHDTFVALIDNNTNLSNIEKFYYLKGCLKGEAGEILQSLEISNNNYQIAWELLKQRFENKRVIIEKHVQSLFEYPSMNKESANSLRKAIDDFSKHIRALKALGEPTEQWDRLLIHLLTSKLDITTKREWQEFTISKEKSTLPKFSDLITFLTNRYQVLETIVVANNPNKVSNFKHEKKRYYEHSHTHLATSNITCEFCKNSHYIYQCEKFKKLPVKKRYEEVKRLKLCINCLRNNHFSQNCKASGCKHCHKRHNSLLHMNNAEEIGNLGLSQAYINKGIDKEANPVSNSEGSSSVNTHVTNIKPESRVLLSTALVYVRDSIGAYHKARVLLDSGSQSNFISDRLCQKLKLAMNEICLPVTGINQSSMEITNSTRIKIKSIYNNFQTELFCLVIPRITKDLPNFTFNTNSINIPDNLSLADPSFSVPSKIDILLGAGIFWELLCAGQIKTGPGQPILQKSKFGWILSGPINTVCHKSNEIENGVVSNLSLHEQVEKFWILEETSDTPKMSREELECEKEFLETTKREESGRFVVRLPVRENLKELGESETNAKRRFLSLENKLSKTPTMKEQYDNFMSEYESLGHMEKISEKELQNERKLTYYIPHHGIYKESSLTTQLRVVFDASARTTSNLSLNDVLKTGPKIQDDLFAILLRFRKHNLVLTADIEKMYRQIRITPEQQDLQRILWRKNPDEDIQHFRLTTVTYGSASASYLAIRSLQQVAHENEHLHPDVAQVILKDFYVDDLITGAETIEKAIYLKDKLTQLLESYGFHLRKWISNENKVLDSTVDKTELLEYYITDNGQTKTLGMRWNAGTDLLSFDISNTSIYTKRLTKRVILSTIAQIFDPLGLIGPITVRAKIIMQKIWQLKLDWDESVPLDIFTTCSRFFNRLLELNNLNIERHCVIRGANKITLHGFCDASVQAYGACIYIVSIDANHQMKASLLCAKSRVAPLKSISLPRLELCGALLLAQLIHCVVKALELKISDIFYWTDSTIVLSWLMAEPSTWQTFVSNRTSQIQELSNVSQWRHVLSADNPADIISRGIEPHLLLKSDLWFHGPSWLCLQENNWPRRRPIGVVDNIPEKRKAKLVNLNITTDFDIFHQYSTFHKLKRVVAYCFRFVNNSKVSSENRITGCLTSEETNHATEVLVKIVQQQEFSQEINNLKQGKSISRKSKLLQLNVFLDDRGLLRVGGRISKTSAAYDKKHPIVLPQKHSLTKLIIKDEHHRHLHAGAQAILSAVRLKFWPLNGKHAVRTVIRNCVTCFRANPYSVKQIMGALPENRVNMTRPFLVTGVDYAGPFDLKEKRFKNRSLIKGYICMFVCFSTKAVHIEVVGDLTAESFLNALKRFTARRGICKILYSDNATNFVGANNKLVQSCNHLMKTDVNFQSFLSKNQITWQFIPARSPHHGGLWEAAIKSAKFHIKRVIGKALLHYEDFCTVITQIEAVLNSRPLIPLTNDPNDLVALSPSHFLIGDYLMAIPEVEVQLPTNRLRHYQKLQQMVQHFWRRWSHEYLTSLQRRTKWQQSSSTQLGVGTMVLLKEDNLPPLLWKIGRIEDVHPGSDGVVRVVSIRTANGTVKRAVQNICILPINYH